MANERRKDVPLIGPDGQPQRGAADEAVAQTQVSPPDAVLAAERRRAEAVLAGEFSTLATLLHPGLVYVHGTGLSHTKQELLKYLADGPTFLRIDFVPTQWGGCAPLCWLNGPLDLTLRRPAESSPVDIRTWVTAVWEADVAQGWQLRVFQSTSQPPSKTPQTVAR